MRNTMLSCVRTFCLLLLCSNASASFFEQPFPLWVKNSDPAKPIKIHVPYPQEPRVMFDEDIAWALSKKNTDAILDRLEQAGFNVYIPCVWHGRGTYFKSKIAHIDHRLYGRMATGDDPLLYLIEQAKKRSIEIHPWFTVTRREDEKLTQFYDDGSPAKAFDVQNPAFRDFIKNLMLEVVNNYGIQGVNLDYIRSMGYCRSKRCAKEYKETTGRSLSTDLLREKIPKSRIQSIEQWNEKAIEDIVYRFSSEAKKIKPNILISVDSVPNARHLRMQGHDSIKWLNAGYIDVIFYMLYKYEIDVSDVNSAKNKAKNPKTIIPILTLYDMDSILPKKPELIQRYIEASRVYWPQSGLAFYHYKHLKQEHIETLTSGVYAKRSVPYWTQ